MKFTKMQGCGNDYVYINCFRERVAHPEQLAVQVSDRHFGIGSDGLILIGPSQVADVRMNMYNADGTQAQMCGNGIRCVARYAYEHGLVNREELTVETLAGIKQLKLRLENKTVTAVTVDMGQPVTEPDRIPVAAAGDAVIARPVEVAGKRYELTCVSMGNPHAVTFVESVDDLPMEAIGPEFEHHPLFPERVNTEFVELVDRKTIRMRVWERGSGETLACGTGACASVYACILNGKTEDEVTVCLLGGELTVTYERTTGHILMTGPAVVVFDGEFYGESKKEEAHV